MMGRRQKGNKSEDLPLIHHFKTFEAEGMKHLPIDLIGLAAFICLDHRNRMQKIVKQICLLVFLPYMMYGQEVDTIAFNAQSDTLYFHQTSSEILLPSKTAGNILQMNPSVFLRNSTLGGIQTISAQGLSSQHVQVLWNDIPVNSGMLGVSDLSLFSVGYHQSVQYNTHGQEWTTGGVAGIVNIKDSKLNDDGYALGIVQSVGSFGQSLSKIHHRGHHKSVHWSFTAGYKRAKNDFPFIDYTVYPNKKKFLVNSSYSKWYIYPKWQIKLNEKNTINFYHELLFSHRDVPPFMVTPNNLAYQKDGVSRNMIKWTYQHKSWSHTVQGLYSLINLYYNDDVLKRDSDNQEHLYYLRYQGHWEANSKWKISLMTDFKRTTIITSNYSDKVHELGNDMTAIVKFQPNIKFNIRGLAKASIRSDMDGYFPLLLEMNSYLGKDLQWKLWTSVGSDIRYPTLNDRYWEPGGLKSLLPEKSINSTVGFSNHYSLSKNVLGQTKVELFVNRIHQMIFWMPTNRGYYQPMNLNKVLAYGLTWSNELKWTRMHHQFEVDGSYSLNRSGNLEKRFTNDKTQWVQLPYFPIHSGKFSLLYSWKSLKLLIESQNYSKRNVTRDAGTFIPAYHLFNSMLSYTYQIKQFNFEGQFSFNNIFNERYEEVRYRPMPGRNFLFTLIINWKHEKN